MELIEELGYLEPSTHHDPKSDESEFLEEEESKSHEREVSN